MHVHIIYHRIICSVIFFALSFSILAYSFRKKCTHFNIFLPCIFKTGCLRNREISKDTALLSAKDNITAFRDSLPLYPVKNITKAFWCDNIGIGNYVNMIFSQPVVIEGIISSGATSNNSQVQHYVSSFTILHSATVNGPLQLYSVEVSCLCRQKMNLISLVFFL